MPGLALNGNGKAHADYVLLPVDDEVGSDSRPGMMGDLHASIPPNFICHIQAKQPEEGKAAAGKGSSSPPPPSVPFSRLFYFADGLDVLLMTVGGIGAC